MPIKSKVFNHFTILHSIVFFGITTNGGRTTGQNNDKA